jgi:hypothetical protein
MGLNQINLNSSTEMFMLLESNAFGAIGRVESVVSTYGRALDSLYLNGLGQGPGREGSRSA